MLTLMTGAWSDKPIHYDSIRAYLDGKDGKGIENYTNEYIKEHLPKAPKFVMGDNEKDLMEQFINKNKSVAYPNADGSFDATRFHNLCIDAVDYIFRIQGYYELYY